MNCWKSLYVHNYQHHKVLIQEQKLGELNLLYSILGNTFNPVHVCVNQVLIHTACLLSK